jgi:hypothetical protein
MLIRVDPADLLEELIAALVAVECLVLRLSADTCRAVLVKAPGPYGAMELRFFVKAWANSRSAVVNVSA